MSRTGNKPPTPFGKGVMPRWLSSGKYLFPYWMTFGLFSLGDRMFPSDAACRYDRARPYHRTPEALLPRCPYACGLYHRVCGYLSFQDLRFVRCPSVMVRTSVRVANTDTPGIELKSANRFWLALFVTLRIALEGMTVSSVMPERLLDFRPTRRYYVNGTDLQIFFRFSRLFGSMRSL